ncbi:MAG: hypothetical protein Q9195_004922 [Heterodermia aff. obscurata]
MHFTTFLSTTLALTANAFLLPAEIADEVQAAKAKAANLVPSLLTTQQSLTLDCGSCPFALQSERHGVHEWTNDVQSDLQMDFAAQNNHLTLNGKPFYPVTIKDLPGELFVHQIKKDTESEKTLEGYNGDLKLSYTLEIPQPEEVDGHQVATVILSILGLDGEMVRVDDVKIKAIKAADGSLSLASVEPVPASPNDPDAKCTTMMCRVMTKLGSVVAKARAKAASAAAATASAAKKVKCFCMRLAGHPAADGKTTHLPTHNHVRPGHFGASHRGPGMHHGAHHHGFAHSALALARRLFTFVLIPVMIGVAVGITASAVGMLIGQLVVLLWMKFRRSGSSQQGVYEVVESEDKEEGLPAYDADGLPAYTDVEGEKKQVENLA